MQHVPRGCISFWPADVPVWTTSWSWMNKSVNRISCKNALILKRRCWKCRLFHTSHKSLRSGECNQSLGFFSFAKHLQLLFSNICSSHGPSLLAFSLLITRTFGKQSSVRMFLSSSSFPLCSPCKETERRFMLNHRENPTNRSAYLHYSCAPLFLLRRRGAGWKAGTVCSPLPRRRSSVVGRTLWELLPASA